ncbi:MAG: tetratricopeptide repeat protein [Xanthomonadaceae bacterium]|nr:tetratricopeptide repeat protein [Xanthomonadaceae bacterium]
MSIKFGAPKGILGLVAILAITGSAHAGPKNGEEWLEQGKQFAAQKNIKKAVRSFKKASRFANTKDAATIALAKFLVDNKDVQTAMEVMSKYLKKENPFSVEGHLFYADLLLTKGDYDTAKKEIQIMKVLRPTWAPGKEIIGLIAFHERKADEAIANLSYFLKENPKSYRARMARGKTFLLLNKTDDAVTDFKILSEQYPDDVPVFELLGDSYLNNRQFAASEAIFERLIGMQPEMGSYYEKLARSQEALGKTEKALISYERMIQYSPSEIEPAFHYTEILVKLGRTPAAEKEWRREVSHDVGFEPAVKSLLNVWTESNRLDEIASLLEKFCKKYPERTWAVTQYTKLLLSIEQIDRAQEVVARHREVTTNLAEAYVLEAMVLRAADKKADALSLLTKANQRIPGVAAIQYNAGLIAEEIGETDRSINWYRQVSGDTKLLFQARVNMALLFEKMGNYSESIAILRSVDAPADQRVVIQKKITELQGYGATVGGPANYHRVPASH